MKTGLLLAVINLSHTTTPTYIGLSYLRSRSNKDVRRIGTNDFFKVKRGNIENITNMKF